MAITVDGIVAVGTAVPGATSIDLTFSTEVHRSSPAEASCLLIVSEATSADLAIFGAAPVTTDTAPVQPCYSNLYGTGNLYQGIADGVFAHSLPDNFFAFAHNLIWGVILHDILAGDVLTITYEAGANLNWGRAYALAIRGVLQNPTPFPTKNYTVGNSISGGTQTVPLPTWYDGKSWAWNRFWSLYGGNTATCLDMVLDNSEFDNNVPFQFAEPVEWRPSVTSDPGPGDFAILDGYTFMDSGITSLAFSPGGVIEDHHYYVDGPDNVSQVQSHMSGIGTLDYFDPPFKLCANHEPTWFHNESYGIDAIVLNSGLGPPYANPGQCGKGVIVASHFKKKLPSTI